MDTLEATNTAELTTGQAAGLIAQLSPNPQQYPLAHANTTALQHFFASQADENILYLDAHYSKDDTPVLEGIIQGITHPNFTYSTVPLGVIVQGEIAVTKGGKATKSLGPGDVIGLFETADWLLTGQKRHIGDWTLAATQPTEVLYFSEQALRNQGSSTETLRQYLIGIARADRVPQPITNQPLLDWLAAQITPGRLSEYAIVVHTHLLPSSFPFFRHLAYLVGFGRIFFMEKPYSTVRSTYNDLIQSGCEVVQVPIEAGVAYEHALQKSADILWAKVVEEQRRSHFKKLLIIDDGGELWVSLPWEKLEGVQIAGVEQTQRGISRIEGSSHRLPPVVSVATSRVKKEVESGFIGKSVVDKLQELNLLTDRRIGILGQGAIGLAARKRLEELGVAPLFYDPQNPAGSESSIDALLNSTDVILGTTGTDTLKGVALERIHGHKVLASASSIDIEFSSLLKLAEPSSDPFGTRHVQVHQDFTADILNGGFPINFDRVKNAVPEEDIVLTWCLMYAGAMQAVGGIENQEAASGIQELNPEHQEMILQEWQKLRQS